MEERCFDCAYYTDEAEFFEMILNYTMEFFANMNISFLISCHFSEQRFWVHACSGSRDNANATISSQNLVHESFRYLCDIYSSTRVVCYIFFNPSGTWLRFPWSGTSEWHWYFQRRCRQWCEAWKNRPAIGIEDTIVVSDDEDL